MHIVSIIFPLIFIVALGYGCCRLSFFNKQHITGLSKFTFYISLPAFLLLNMSQIDLKQSISLSAFLFLSSNENLRSFLKSFLNLSPSINMKNQEARTL